MTPGLLGSSVRANQRAMLPQDMEELPGTKGKVSRTVVGTNMSNYKGSYVTLSTVS